MKLAIVTAYPPSKVTLNEYAYYLVKHFRKHQDVSELILLIDVPSEEADIHFEEEASKISVRHCWNFNSYTNLFTVMKAINEVKPDAVLFNLQFMKFGDKKIPAALGLLLPGICKLKGIPTITLLHNILEQVDLKSAGFTSNKIMQKVYNFIGTTLTRFILASDTVAVTISKYVEVLNEKYMAKNVKLIPHGTFEIPETPNYNIPEGSLKVMTFGKFGTYKKVEILIEAIEKIRATTNRAIEIVVAGTDNPNVPGYLKSVQETYKNVPQLTFTGYVAEEDVAGLFEESAVVVFPYTSTTGSSGVLHQAGSYGKAVVMPDLGDLSILVKEEGYRGEFFTPESVDSLATAIQSILENDAYRISLGKANYNAATALPMSKIVDMYMDEFNEIIDRKVSGVFDVAWRKELVG
ncbi:glycosyltransferase [Aquimarina agarilytica]|uniref:glycosyltransferase n=1 Tax=Aquimarina agarilytica TaxID=1087449 RepID=UPI000288C37C|nr:glycosyltransferase [Aquimarina agarilytica]